MKILSIRSMALAVFCALWLIPSIAASAPFCVESQGLAAECWYHDIRTCREEATARNGFCSVNRSEITIAESGAPYCVIDSSGIPVCAFQGGESCQEAAARMGGVCFENTGGDAVSDPFRFDRALYRDR